MDIHESFQAHVEALKEVIKKFDDQEEQRTNWEIFSSFLRDLIFSYDDRFKSAILQTFFPEETDLHEKIKELFYLLTEYEKSLESMVYTINADRVTIDFNKVIDEEI